MFAAIVAPSHLRELLLPEGISHLLLLLAVSAAALWWAENKFHLLTRFMHEEAAALNLAIVRIVIFISLIFRVRLSQLLAFGRLENTLIFPPLGWKWIAPHLPRQEGMLAGLYYLLIVSALLAAIGLWTRVSTKVAVVVGFYLLTVPQLFGHVVHYHHLMFFALILAFSPCADALSADSWLRRRGTGHSVSMFQMSIIYATPLKIMMVVMGFVYFFPGAWKVCRLGLRWFSADSMRTLLLVKMQEFTPTQFQLSMLQHPFVLVMGAIFTIAFEIGFIFLILDRRTRVLAFLMGLTFHNMTYLLMHIRFWDLQVCYVILLDWAALVAFVGLGLDRHERFRRDEYDVHGLIVSRAPLRVLGTFGIAGMFLAGVLHIVNGWPVACYPTFDWQSDSLVNELGVQAQTVNGEIGNFTLDFDPRLEDEFSSERWKSLVEEVTRADIPDHALRGEALLRVWAAAYHRTDLRSATLYLDTYDFAKSTTVPIERREIATVPVTSAKLGVRSGMTP